MHRSLDRRGERVRHAPTNSFEHGCVGWYLVYTCGTHHRGSSDTSPREMTRDANLAGRIRAVQASSASHVPAQSIRRTRFTRRAISQTHCCQHLCLNGKPFLFCLCSLPWHPFLATGTEMDPLETCLLTISLNLFRCGGWHHFSLQLLLVELHSFALSWCVLTRKAAPNPRNFQSCCR